MSRPIAWHYTTGENFLRIAEDAWLDPKRTVTFQGERSVLWFSTADFWEATAQKELGSSTGERVGKLGMQGTYQLGSGLVRLGIAKRQLVPWPKLGRRAGMSTEMIKSLESVGREQGASPNQWHGSFKRIRVRDCVVEVFDGECWERIQEGRR